MPVPYEKLTVKDILYHQAAYDCFDDCGRQLFDGWDIIGLEKAALGCGDNHYLYMAEQIRNNPGLFNDLNERMPFLKFAEAGQHYGYELFLSDPGFWGSRGAPLFWAFAARRFTYDKLPMDERYLQKKYLDIAAEFHIPSDGDEYVYIERFAAGGMSSGVVGSRFIRESINTLMSRNRKYRTFSNEGRHHDAT